MNEPAAVSDRSCLDCGTPLRPEQNFCYHCAQRADVKRLTIHAIGHDFLHAVFHADRSVFSLLKALLIRPGHVAREYVAGMRRRHFGPFATLIILMGIAAVLLDVTGFQSFTRPTGVPLNGLLNFLQLHTHEGCDFCGGHHLDDEDELTRVSNAVVDLVHEGKPIRPKPLHAIYWSAIRKSMTAMIGWAWCTRLAARTSKPPTAIARSSSSPVSTLSSTTPSSRRTSRAGSKNSIHQPRLDMSSDFLLGYWYPYNWLEAANRSYRS